jgi:hypothetical protein
MLDLSFKHIGLHGLSEMKEYLKCPSKLRLLNMKSNSLGEECGAVLKEGLTGN